MFTLELLHPVRYGTVRYGAVLYVRVYTVLRNSVFRQIKGVERRWKYACANSNELQHALAPSWMCSSFLYLCGPPCNDVLFLLASLNIEHVDFKGFGSGEQCKIVRGQDRHSSYWLCWQHNMSPSAMHYTTCKETASAILVFTCEYFDVRTVP